MSRLKVWTEAYEVYAIKKQLADPNIIYKMSDDELTEYVFSAVERDNLQEEFNLFKHDYCMTNK